MAVGVYWAGIKRKAANYMGEGSSALRDHSVRFPRHNRSAIPTAVPIGFNMNEYCLRSW